MLEEEIKEDPNSAQYLQALTKQTQALYACQDAKGLSSCWDCKQLLGCETRTAYVNSVYESMNQGQSDKDFNF